MTEQVKRYKPTRLVNHNNWWGMISDKNELSFSEAQYPFDYMVPHFYHHSDYEQLQARVKELESVEHINEIKAQGVEGAIAHVKGLDKHGSTKVLLAIQATINRLQEYAQQLRKGGDDDTRHN